MTHQMQILDETGHSTLEWTDEETAANDAAVKEAELVLAEHIKKGGLAYKLDKDDAATGEMITKFEKDAPRIILTPAMRGG